MDILKLFPKDHFGAPQKKIIDCANNGISVLVYAMYGTGLQYLLRFTKQQLRKNSELKVIFLRGSLLQEESVETIKNALYEALRIKSEAQLQSALNEHKDKRIVLMIDSFQHVQQKSEALKFLGELRKTNLHTFSSIIGIDHTFLSTHRAQFIAHPDSVASVVKFLPLDVYGLKRNMRVNNEFYGFGLPLDLAETIFKLSGGNSSLTKYISKVVSEEGLDKLSDLDYLATHFLIEPRLVKLLGIVSQLDADKLTQLGVINSSGELFSDLLKYKIMNYEIPDLQIMLPRLSTNERRVFSYLFLNIEKLVTVEKLDFLMGLSGEKYSLWASYKAISRLRKKIESKFLLVNVKDRGYMLQRK